MAFITHQHSLRTYFLVLVVLNFLSVLHAQSPSKIRKKADNYYKNHQYDSALVHYLTVKDAFIKNIPIKYNIGKCYYEVNAFQKSIEYLEFYLANINKAAPETNLILAKSNHMLLDFEKAASYYKKHLKTLKAKDPQRNTFKSLILQCMGGALVANTNSGAIVSNLGPGINSKADDYRAIFHPKYPAALFFSSNREGSKKPPHNKKNPVVATPTDMYKASIVQGTWEGVKPLSDRYNTSLGEDIISFFDAGYQMLILKKFADGHTEIVKENYDDDSLEVCLPFALAASTDDWDSDHFFVNDSLILFSSNRQGGYGGKDLYFSIKNDSLGWTEAINMGAVINSPFDDVSPYLTDDGRYLYFSSNRQESMGGYDIFRTIFVDSVSNWTKAINMGAPLNTAADERDFMLSEDAQKAYFSSNRPQGQGGYDIYAAYFRYKISSGDPLNGFTQHSNSATEHNNNAAANPGVNSQLFKFEVAPFYYNKESGAFEGSRNSIKALTTILTSYPETKVILTAHTDNSGDLISDLYLSIKQAEQLAETLMQRGVLNEQILLRGCGQNYPIAKYENFDGSNNPLSSKLNRRINAMLYNTDSYPLLEISYKNPEISTMMQDKAASSNASFLEGLTYRVQITATPGIFNHSILSQYENCVTEKTPQDMDVSYLVGLEKNYKAIAKIRQQLIDQGYNNTAVIPYINGLPITEAEALKSHEQYPDLKNYINR